jgi:hypothetical protein
VLTSVQLLATNNFGDTREGGLAGPMGLFLIILLSVATVLLIRNMNSRLRRLPDSFPDQSVDRMSGSAVLDPTLDAGHQDSGSSAPKGAHLPGNPASRT